MKKASLVSFSPLAASVLLAASISAQDPRWFDAPMILDNLPGYIVGVSDRDLDGDLDAIASEFVSPNWVITLLDNPGWGEMLPGATITLPAGTVGAIRITDVGGDGIDDIVVATVGSPLLGGNVMGHGLLVYAGQVGGTFASPTFLALPGRVAYVEPGRANADASGDLFVQVAIGTGMQAFWVFGAANHTLTQGPSAAIPHVPGGQLPNGQLFEAFAHTTQILDYDGDQVDDVVVIPRVVTTVTLAPLLTVGGALLAAPTLSLPSQASNICHPLPIDSDQDGDVDLAISYKSSTFDRALVVVENLGAGSWSVLPAQPMPNNVVGPLAAGDWNEDGKVDIVLRQSRFLSGEFAYNFLRAQSPHTFVAEPDRRLPDAHASPVGIWDMNGDSHLDYVVGNTIVFGNGDLPKVIAGGATVVDWDRDEDIDIADGNLLLTNDGRAKFAESALALPAAPPGTFLYYWHDLQDLDGDGLREIVATHLPGLAHRLWRESASGAFIDVGLANLVSLRDAPPQLADFDGDGDLDAYTWEQVYTFDGTTFQASGVGFGPSTMPVALGDVDADQDVDVLVRTGSSQTGLSLCQRTSTGFLSQVLIAGIASSGGAPQSAILHDLDDDGDLDVAATERMSNGENRVRLFRNVNGVLSPAGSLDHGGPITAGDVDGDGNTDLCVSTDGRLTLLRRTGFGLTYASPVVFGAGPLATLVDLDQDGDLDGVGAEIVSSLRFTGDQAGFRRQYGIGSPGTGGRTPILSLTDPIRTGFTPKLALRNAVGGSFALLVMGNTEANQPSLLLPGVQDYVGQIVLLLGFGSSGAPGQAGAGEVDVAVGIPPGLFGTRLFFEFVLLDAGAPTGFCHTNGCEMFVGL